MLDPNVQFTIPSEWKVPLPVINQDSNPFVEEGYLGTHIYKSTSGGFVTFADIGVDFRGITLAVHANDSVGRIDTWVAGFTVTDTHHPDILYVLTIPFLDLDGSCTDLDILPNGTFTYDTIQPPYPTGIKAHALIQLLQNPSIIGKRMVMSIKILNSNHPDDFEVTPDNRTLANAIQNGIILSGSHDIRLTLRNVHIPHDIHPQ